MAPSTAGSKRHGGLSLCFLVSSTIAFVHEHRLSPPRRNIHTPHKSLHSVSGDGVQDEEDDQSEAMLNELRDIKNGMGANIPSTSELQGAAQNAEDDFLAAMLQQTSEFREIKEAEGGERAIEVFMEKIQESESDARVEMEVDAEAPGEQGGGRETAEEFADGSAPGSAPGGSEDVWQ